MFEFIEQGWGFKSIEIKGWASPEGEETFNKDLSEKLCIRHAEAFEF